MTKHFELESLHAPVSRRGFMVGAAGLTFAVVAGPAADHALEEQSLVPLAHALISQDAIFSNIFVFSGALQRLLQFEDCSVRVSELR